MTRSLTLVSAGLREPSATRLLGDRVVAATTAALQAEGIVASVEVIELREHAQDLTNNLLTSFASEPLQAVKDRVAATDGLIAVSPIFSASYSGLFKTFFDLLDEDALSETPVLIAATAGTSRHSLALEHALRPLFVYLRAVVVPTAVFASSEDWGPAGGIDEGLSERIERASGELAALVADRPPRPALDPYADPTAFEELLRGGPT
jgi:FMN reductase